MLQDKIELNSKTIELEMKLNEILFRLDELQNYTRLIRSNQHVLATGLLIAIICFWRYLWGRFII